MKYLYSEGKKYTTVFIYIGTVLRESYEYRAETFSAHKAIKQKQCPADLLTRLLHFLVTGVTDECCFPSNINRIAYKQAALTTLVSTTLNFYYTLKQNVVI